MSELPIPPVVAIQDLGFKRDWIVPRPDELAVPTKILDELWHDIKCLKAGLATFVYNARLSVQEKEMLTGEYDLDFYSWLEPLIETVNQMRNIKRYAPGDGGGDSIHSKNQ